MPWSDPLGNPMRAKADIATPVGTRKVLPLPDGGSIVLNSDSRVLLDYDPHSRDVTLLKGEIAVDAKHDAERPFRLVAGPRQFEVPPGDVKFHLRKVTPERLELTLLHGQLSVSESRMPHPVPAALLRARVSYGPYVFSARQAGTLGPGWQTVWMLSEQELDRRTAWQSGRIVIDHEPLEDALREIERYTTSRFVFGEEALRSVRMNAVIKAGDIAGLTRYLRSELHIGARGTTAGTIVLTRLPPGSSGGSALGGCPANYSCRRLDSAAHIRFFYGPPETQ
jgi:transmembrane sensor